MIGILVLFYLLPYRALTQHVWSVEQAHAWYRAQPLIIGCNYIPAYAVNPIEMWQDDTFDTIAIRRELMLAKYLGFNSLRVFLHETVYRRDSLAYKKRIDLFLRITHELGMKVIPVLFDDCWFLTPTAGTQPLPRPGVHNSGWVMCPGKDDVKNRHRWDELKKYVEDIIHTFKDDERILFWDVYNEPGGSGLFKRSRGLLQESFRWARSANPSQPLTSGLYAIKACSKIQRENSDIITFHCYGSLRRMKNMTAKMKRWGRPVICTEYLARPRSTFFTHLPFLVSENVGAINWGLVSGKTQTIYPWRTRWIKPMKHEPKIWFHDIFKPDYSPYCADEVELIRMICTKQSRQPYQDKHR